MKHFCIICGVSAESTIHIHKVPQDENKRLSWIQACGKFLSSGSYVCSKHFPPEDVGRKRLKNGALPILCSSQSIPVPNPERAHDISNIFVSKDDERGDKSLFSLIMSGQLEINLPCNWGSHKLDKKILFSKVITDKNGKYTIERSVVVTEHDVQAHINNKANDSHEVIKTKADLDNYIKTVNKSNVCQGSSKSCSIFIPENTSICKSCTSYRYYMKNKIEIKKKRIFVEGKIKKKLHYIKQRNRRLSKVICNLKRDEIDHLRLDHFIKDLPQNQQEMIKACYKAGQCKKKGNRYTLDWVYSCILMKIKSTRLYNHMRDNNILPLPSPSTLSRYIRNIDGGFGFKAEVFSLLKEKCKHLKEWERHGCLLIDECKITATKKFDKNTLEMIGFIDLGNHTPEKMADQLGDHALVFMFQPFAGHSLQALACFLSGGNINGDIQAKLVLECIILCENAGLYIDVVTSDGASWNRKMWSHLGINDSLKPWCEHPIDSSRKLRMCSDFPHLIKCMRNNLVAKRIFKIPEGLVPFANFETLFEYECTKQFKICFKLTESHLHPKNGEKMCTRLAFQLFSNTTALAMEAYKNKIDSFEEIDVTIMFCKKINRIIDLMNSRSPDSGLRYNSREYKELIDFLDYLKSWEACSEKKMYISDSTSEGLKATVSCTLDLIEYLSSIGFTYLMTSRINQDHLEHFFGMMRSAGGCNTHPESLQVGQLFRLMSLYSLIKPPRGSNVSGGEMMKSLLNVGELKENKNKFSFDIEISDRIVQVTEEFVDISEAFAYFCGYVAKKIKAKNTCQECSRTIIGDGNEFFNNYIKLKSRGYLTFPSATIISFLSEVESVISEIFQKDLRRNCLTDILHKLSNFMPKTLVGCIKHKFELSKHTLTAYILSRLSICCANEQKLRNAPRKSKHFAKLAKLQ